MLAEWPEMEKAGRKVQAYELERDGIALWKTRKEELLRQKQREQSELRQMLANYSPWGKPGGGAPCTSCLRKRNVLLEPEKTLINGNFAQGWTNEPPFTTNMNKFYDARSLQRMSGDPDPACLRDEEIQVYRLTGGIKSLPLLTKKRYHSTYHISDATKPGFTLETLRALNAGNREYITELAEQMRKKREKAMEERRMDREICRRHFETWKKFWGRPGHGAPIDHAQRTNLHDILHRF